MMGQDIEREGGNVCAVCVCLKEKNFCKREREMVYLRD